MSYSSNSVSGTLLYGVIAGVLTAVLTLVARYGSRSIFRVLVRIAAKLPPRTRRALRRSADRVAPTWRSIGGFRRPPLDMRLRQIREKKRFAILLIGGVYLDIRLFPVDIVHLEEGEFSDLDRPRVDIGGSASWVGRFLYKSTHDTRRSYLFTRLGDDAFSKDLRRSLHNARWIKKLYAVKAETSVCGVSFDLEPRENKPSTTLTHRGSLGGFNWHQILDDVNRKAKRGGVIYISGYFRTDLCRDLRDSLEALPARTIVCVDHGRFRREDYDRGGPALVSVFQEGLIDVYLCNHFELREFASSAGVAAAGHLAVEELLRACVRARVLPTITVVCGEAGATSAVAHSAYQGEVKRIELSRRTSVPRARLGTRNAFNAGFLHEFASGASEMETAVALESSVRYALQLWTEMAPVA
jgi:sugar/nucleoside kinase (ribokinase family)